MIAHFNWQIVRKWSRRIAITFAVLYVADVMFASMPRTPKCPVEEHSFSGQKFDVEFCLSYASDRHHMGIRVYSKTGEYLAKRWATFAKEGRLNYMAIEDAMIRYSDDTSDLRSASIPEDCVLNMPPTWVDWLEARLPGGIPGVNHCGMASRDEVRKAQNQWALREEADRKKEEAATRQDKAQKKAAPNAPALSR